MAERCAKPYGTDKGGEDDLQSSVPLLSQACSVSETAKQRRAVRTVRLLRHVALEKRTHFSYGPGS